MNTTIVITEQYILARKSLNGTYKEEQHNYMQQQIEVIISKSENKKYALKYAWKVVNQISVKRIQISLTLKLSIKKSESKMETSFDNLLENC